ESARPPARSAETRAPAYAGRRSMFGNLARVIFFFAAGGGGAPGDHYVGWRAGGGRAPPPPAPGPGGVRRESPPRRALRLEGRRRARAVSGSAPSWLFTPFLVWLGFALYLLLTIAVLDGARAVYLRWRVRRGDPVSTERRAFLSGSLAAGSAVVGVGLGVFGT